MKPDNNHNCNFRHVVPMPDVPVEMIRAFLNWDPDYDVKEDMVMPAVKLAPPKIHPRWKSKMQRKVIWTTLMKVAI